MSKKPKLLLIDGMNLCFREFYSKKNLSFHNQSVDVIYGVFKSLASYHKSWPDHFRIIAWEGGYERRLRESEAGVEKGLIPSSYKQNRRDKREQEPDDELESLFEQISILKELLQETKTLQVRMKGYEGDDVIHSYADWAVRHGGEAIIISSDQDFYQCLSQGVKVYDAKDGEMWTLGRLEKECGLTPELWLDKAAIEGEIGPSKDNIFGVDGWGNKTAFKYVQEFGGIPEITAALEAKNKRGKREDTFLAQQERLQLAKSLKMMDIIDELPMPRVVQKFDEKDVKKMLISWGFASLMKDAWRFV